MENLDLPPSLRDETTSCISSPANSRNLPTGMTSWGMVSHGAPWSPVAVATPVYMNQAQGTVGI